ncbi:SDR family oxidoreductase [Streptomyces sp. 8P21H-1]|uniref:SDR family NAD(P)-dependent oxidoreductase n=1 Tax=Streptomyces sp. 8P21H-1 TaxID=2737048 RepID=UPI00156F224B|nr:SDR family oxidoreductase [Streptomyces sp. 8P21H-1]NSL42710.1 SDR family oxidoreductase [Streptomyces sp. 8P21H-1]
MERTSGRGLTVITGASSGIGAQLARELGKQGAALLLTGRNAERLRGVACEIETVEGVTVETVPADLTRTEGVDAVIKAIENRDVDVLINNAGFATYGPHHTIDPDTEASLISVNCGALVALTHAVLPQMIERGRGTVMNVASTIAFQPAPLQAVYGASKAFVLSYSEALHEETRSTGVCVIALCPGPTSTGFVAAMNSPEASQSTVYGKVDSAEHVTRTAVRALRSRRAIAVVGIKNSLTINAARFAPRSVTRRLAARMLRPR